MGLKPRQAQFIDPLDYSAILPNQFLILFLIGQLRPLFRLFLVFSNKKNTIFKTNTYMWKNVHPIDSAEIQTHNLQNVSHFPLPLDQGSSPQFLILTNFSN